MSTPCQQQTSEVQGLYAVMLHPRISRLQERTELHLTPLPITSTVELTRLSQPQSVVVSLCKYQPQQHAHSHMHWLVSVMQVQPPVVSHKPEGLQLRLIRCPPQ